MTNIRYGLIIKVKAETTICYVLSDDIFYDCSKIIVLQVMGQNKSEVNYSSPAEEYFQREVLEVHKSQGIAE